MTFLFFFIIFSAAFAAAFLDSSYKMGYGILTPILLLLDYTIVHIIPIILLVQFITGFSKLIYYYLYRERAYKSSEKVSLKLTGWFMLFAIIGLSLGLSFILLFAEMIVLFYISFMLIGIGITLIFNFRAEYTKNRLAFMSALGS
ncbi:MAG: TSUP family transporter, partial [Candidatus Lokiarchaeota archaeon]|nr:TSUP family transporter [Candidatus Lokiarchaeota archaeon]MBD3343331.1 TSUP family transporter [Candidatus Lokiarchaeota archaeon]